MRSLRGLVLLAGAVALPVVPGAAQCAYPQPPAGGHVLTELLGEPLTFADGFRTRMDVRFPATSAPACGWPLVLAIHALGTDRRNVAQVAVEVARRGYATVAWDLRGQGEARGLNGGGAGCAFVGADERLDMAELPALIAGRYGNVDARRLGVIGLSQGALHAWAAAAWSGKLLPANGRGISRMPAFAAAVARAYGPWFPETVFPDGKAVATKFLVYLFLVNLVDWEPGFASLRQRILAEDFAGGVGLLAADPFRQDLTELGSATTPLLAATSWNDSWVAIGATLDGMARLRGPRRALLSYPAHDDPYNLWQLLQIDLLGQRWFDRFLKGERNGVEEEARFVAGVRPASQARYVNALDPVANQHLGAWPPPAATPRRFHLRQGGLLSPAPPAAAEPADRIRHRVAAGFDISQFVHAAQTRLDRTLASIPLSAAAYDAPPITAHGQLAGQATVHLAVDASAGTYQVHCALYRLERGSGPPHFLTSGLGLVRGGSSGAGVLDVAMNGTHVHLAPGDVLRLQVENLAVRGYHDQVLLWVAPYFNDVDVDVHHTAARPSWIDLPLIDGMPPSLTTLNPVLVPVGQPADPAFVLESPSVPDTATYLMLYGTSGTGPGVPFGNLRIALNPDPLTFSLASSPNGILTPFGFGTFAALRAGSSSLPRIAFSSVPGLWPTLLGLRLSAVALTEDRGRLDVSNPVDVLIR